MADTSNKENKITPDQAQQGFVNKLSGEKKRFSRFILAALGSIPWVGGVISASAALSAEVDQQKVNELQEIWLQEHQNKIAELGKTLLDIFSRLDSLGEQIKDRIESPEYLALVRRTFRSWDQSDTQEKKQMLSKLIANAGAKELCPDDLIRLFINWVDQYHEAHFLVIKEIHKNPGVTRGQIWANIYGEFPRDDSAEADLFKYLIRELTLGEVIGQEKETSEGGRILKKQRSKKQSSHPSDQYKTSPFESKKPYYLTKLGEKFVHYVMEDVVTPIGSGEISSN